LVALASNREIKPTLPEKKSEIKEAFPDLGEVLTESFAVQKTKK
jgi:hypothetical protein